MSEQHIENNQDSQSSSDGSTSSTANHQKSPPKIQDREIRISIVAPVIADQFVKQGDKYFHVDSLSCPLSGGDAQSIACQIIRAQFPYENKEPDLVEAILKRAFSGTTKEPEQSIALWNRTTRCAPGNRGRVLRGQYMASINTWKIPDYRQLGMKEADIGMLGEFLDRTFVEPSDKTRFLDWLSWTLQNEQKKPGFAPLLYSREKGTGKSTLCQFVSRLFGKDNTHSANGLSQVTGRFNKPMLDSKLLVLEELKLKPGSNQGNALKSLITEADTSAERKGVDLEKTTQCCCFLFTTNHLPQWIEGNDRRFHVIDMGHEGHASGPKADDFAEFMTEFYEWMDDPENIAKAYNALMHRKQSEGFNPKALNTSKIETPVMKQIRSTSQETLQEQLAEKLEEDGRGAIPQEKLIVMIRN
ncbi:primase-helicase family protein, partial [Marivita geojedonensis]